MRFSVTKIGFLVLGRSVGRLGRSLGPGRRLRRGDIEGARDRFVVAGVERDRVKLAAADATGRLVRLASCFFFGDRDIAAVAAVAPKRIEVSGHREVVAALYEQ
jgi:hypothetical protein